MNTAKIKTALEALQIPSMYYSVGTFIEKAIAPTVFVNISAEDGKGLADYYGEFRGGYPWIHEELVKFATANKGHWEWQDPSHLRGLT